MLKSLKQAFCFFNTLLTFLNKIFEEKTYAIFQHTIITIICFF